MWIKGSLMGLTILDRQGGIAGRVEGTFPYDGSEPEFAVVRIGRFGRRKLVPLYAARRIDPLAIQVPYTAADLDDAPSLDEERYESEQAMSARSHFGTHRLTDDRYDFDEVAAGRDC